MAIFAGAALGAFLVMAPFQNDGALKQLLTRVWIQFWLGLSILIVFGLAIVALLFEWPGYLAFLIAQRLTGVEAAQLLLGGAFGTVLRGYLTSPPQRKSQMNINLSELKQTTALTRTTPMTNATVVTHSFSRLRVIGTSLARYTALLLRRHERSVVEVEKTENSKTDQGLLSGWFERERGSATVLVTLLVVGLIVPYAPSVTARLTGVKTPFGSAEFGEGPPARERLVFVITRRHLNLQALRDIVELPDFIAKDIATLKHVERRTALDDRVKYAEGTISILKELIIPAISCVEELRVRLHHPDSLRDLLRSPTAELRGLLDRGRDAGPEAHDRVVYVFRKLRDDALGVAPHAIRCDPITVERWLGSWPAVGQLRDSPHIYNLISYMLRFVQNNEGAISILKSGRDTGVASEAMYINYLLALALYDGERDERRVLDQLDRALAIAEEQEGLVEAERRYAKQEDKQRELEELVGRYKRAQQKIRNEWAYVAAEAGIGELRAMRYAKEGFDSLKGWSNYWRAMYTDTYGFVKMAYAARKIPPRFDDIREAAKLFDEALVYARSIKDDDDDNQRFAIRIAKEHKEQADKLLVGQ